MLVTIYYYKYKNIEKYICLCICAVLGCALIITTLFGILYLTNPEYYAFKSLIGK